MTNQPDPIRDLTVDGDAVRAAMAPFLADLALTATGAEADRWLDQAQAFRGPTGPGRRPGQFAHLS